MSTIKVDGIRSNSATSDAITLASGGTCTANITNKPNRNLIINGAMQVAQRGTSNTTGGDGYFTVDRMSYYNSGIDNDVTKAQADIASGTTPYSLGFRKSFKLTNGNQTSGFGADDVIRVDTKLEAQDLATSGWNFKSSSSYITLSYWVKSSVAQEFFGYLYMDDTPYKYGWSLGSLSADTWTKITVTIPGNSNLGINNDNGVGCWLNLLGIWGTNRTASDAAPNTWVVWDGTKRSTDQASTWYTTNDATFEITGVQLEVSDHATDFEHRSFGQELALCQRYYFRFTASTSGTHIAMGHQMTSSAAKIILPFPTSMRTRPTAVETSGTASDYSVARTSTYEVCNVVPTFAGASKEVGNVNTNQTQASISTGYAVVLRANTTDCFLGFSAEL